MSHPFDVFVSYAHADGDVFARDLVERLKAAGLSVWLDEEQRPPGAPIDETLAQALSESQHAVFVVTPEWMKRPYTKWELRVFATEQRRRCVAVIRIPQPKESQLGAFLPPDTWLPWQDGDDVDAKFWLLYCGLLDKQPGGRDDWSRRGREAQGAGAQAPGLAAAPGGEVLSTLAIQIELPVALACDRAALWGEVCTYATTTRSEAWFVVGPRRYGHEAFLSRVRQCLVKTPERHIVSVPWNPPWTPVGRSGFLAALAAALGCRTEEQLVAALRSRLLDANLVLVHQPVADDAFERDDLVLYYTKWLPELVGRADPDARVDDRIGGVKALQAVAWWPGGGEPRRAGTAERDARDALKRLTAEQDKARLPVRVLTELDAITREHVERWSEDYLPASLDRRQFVERVMDGARDPAEILDRIRLSFGEDRREAP